MISYFSVACPVILLSPHFSIQSCLLISVYKVVSSSQYTKLSPHLSIQSCLLISPFFTTYIMLVIEIKSINLYRVVSSYSVCCFRGTQFVPLTNINSVMLPAAFILKFKKPVALSHQLIRQIEKLAGGLPYSYFIYTYLILTLYLLTLFLLYTYLPYS